MSLDILSCLSPKVYFVAFIPLAEKRNKEKTNTFLTPQFVLKRNATKFASLRFKSIYVFRTLY